MIKIHKLGVRIDGGRMRKFEDMQQATGLNPSQLVRLLIDMAEVKSRPVVNVQLMKNSDSAKFSQDGSATTVAA